MHSKTSIRERILELLTRCPRPSRHVIRQFLSNSHGKRSLAAACEAIGFDFSRQIMTEISEAEWLQLKELAKDDRLGTFQLKGMLEVQNALIRQRMLWGDEAGTEDPFAFLLKTPENELEKALRASAAPELALMHLYWTEQELSTRVLRHLDPDLRAEVVLCSSHLERLPIDILRQSAERFAEALKVRLEGSIVSAPAHGADPESIIDELARELRQAIAADALLIQDLCRPRPYKNNSVFQETHPTPPATRTI